MTDLQHHTDNAAPVLFTVVSIIGAAFEAQMIVIFLCAILGAGIGLAYRPATEPSKSKFETAMRFLGNTGYILSNAVITTFLSFWINKYWPEAKYPIAFVCGLGLMIYRELLIYSLGNVIRFFLHRKSGGL